MKASFIEKLIGRMDRLDPKSVASIVSRLAQEKGFLEVVFHTLDEGILVLGRESKTLYLNRAARDLLGLPAEFLIGDSIRRHLPEPFWKTLEEDRQELSTQTAVHQDVEIFYPQHRFLQIYTNTLTQENLPDVDLLIIIRDMTESHKKAVQDAESERVEAVNTLAAGVAHEIGNPLNSLHIYMQLIQRELEKLPSDARGRLEKHLQVCMGEIGRLDQIVTQFLKAIRPAEPRFESNSIHEILLEVLEVLKPEIQNRDILVEQELAEHPPRVMVDANQMKQVFHNVIRNSLQAMTRGGILHIRTSVNDDMMLIAIRDSGGGIPAESLKHIFDPYFTTKKDGSGLGLMVVQRVIRDHGGLIEVSSEEKRGTTFRILLPTGEKRTRLLESRPRSVHSEP